MGKPAKLRIVLPQILASSVSDELMRSISFAFLKSTDVIEADFGNVINIRESAVRKLREGLPETGISGENQKIFFINIPPFLAHCLLLAGFPVEKNILKLDLKILRDLKQKQSPEKKSPPEMLYTDLSAVRHTLCPECGYPLQFSISRIKVCPGCQSKLILNRGRDATAYEKLI
jgi:hypothetical protein